MPFLAVVPILGEVILQFVLLHGLVAAPIMRNILALHLSPNVWPVMLAPVWGPPAHVDLFI
jgi:hypothetical protein